MLYIIILIIIFLFSVLMLADGAVPSLNSSCANNELNIMGILTVIYQDDMSENKNNPYSTF